MNVYKKIEEIKDKLRNDGSFELANQINELQSSGGTIGEVFISVFRFLEEQYNSSSSEAMSIVKDDFNEMKKYAKELNYI